MQKYTELITLFSIMLNSVIQANTDDGITWRTY